MGRSRTFAVVGYHGTSRANAEALLAAQTFDPSTAKTCVFGRGFYLADRIADARRYSEGAVLRVALRPGVEVARGDTTLRGRAAHDRFNEACRRRGAAAVRYGDEVVVLEPSAVATIAVERRRR